MLSLCALFYGDYGQYAQRLLGSLDLNLADGRPFLLDIRLGLNEVSPGVADYILGWAEEAACRHHLPILVYRPERNVFKYPLLRRMLHAPIPGHSLGEYVMYFDDDAYLEPGFRWRHMLEYAAQQDMIGHLYYWFIQGQQFAWVKQQRWYDPAVGDPPVRQGRPCFVFAQGSWWVIRREILCKYDWPIPQLRHCGGDSMLGELCRQQRLRLAGYTDRVKVNADLAGRNSKSQRRGHSEPPLGFDLAVEASKDMSFQQFACTVRRYTPHGWHDTEMES